MCPVCYSKKTTADIGRYKVCKTCKTMYLVKPPDENYLRKATEREAGEKIEDANNEKAREIFTKRVEKLKRFFKKADILDVGTGNGLFLELAKQHSFKPFGLEKSSKLVSYLNNKKKINTFSSFAELKGRKFDIITSFDVLEHTVNPHNFIKNIKNHLKKRAVLMITTPNARGISAKILKKHWWVFGPERHFIMFTAYSLSRLFKKSEFELVEVETDTITPWFMPTDRFLNRILNKIVYLLISSLKELLFKRYLGDNIQIILRKK